MRPTRRIALCLPLVLAAPAAAQSVLADDLTVKAIDDVEIGPDGRWAVAREHAGYVGGVSEALFYDLATGVRVADLPIGAGVGFALATGPSQDAVVVTSDRAAVLASGIGIFDTSGAVPTTLWVQDVGHWPRDLAVTPDGSLLVVRGGSTTPGNVGGLYVFDLELGAQVAFAPGEPRLYAPFTPVGFDVDSVVADDEHAVTLSSSAGFTRVTVWDLRPAGGGAPVVAFETTAATDQPGEPHDLVQVPGGRFVAVRSEVSVGLYELAGRASKQVWVRRLFGDPGPFGGSAMDSIEATRNRIATISRWSNGGIGAQLDVFTLAGVGSWDRTSGDPHDVAVAPRSARLVLRTSGGVSLYDLAGANGGRLAPLATAAQPSTSASFGAGLDSVALTDTRAITVARNGATSDVRIWDVSGGGLVPVGGATLPAEALDVDVTPDGTTAAVSGLTHVQLYGLDDGALLLDHDPSAMPGWWPWCDGLAVSDDRVVAFGYQNGTAPGPGWVSILALDAPAP